MSTPVHLNSSKSNNQLEIHTSLKNYITVVQNKIKLLLEIQLLNVDLSHLRHNSIDYMSFDLVREIFGDN